MDGSDRVSDMRHRSPKKEAEYRQRRKFVVQILTETPWCQACGVFAEHDQKITYIKNPATDVHELIRRSQGGSILDAANVIAVCRPCHDRIGRFPALAFELGLAKEGWKREP